MVLAADTRCTRMLTRCKQQIQGAVVYPLPSPALFEQLHDKWQFAQLLMQHNFPLPKTYLIETLESVKSLDLEFPVILKPPTGEGGKSNRRIDDPTTLYRYIHQQFEQNALPLLLQEWIPGRDICLNVLANHGELVAWTIQKLESSNMWFIKQPEVVELGRSLCQACGYHGVGNIDLRIDDRTGNLVFIECNPRFWANMRCSTWMGVNFLALGAKIVCEDIEVAEFKPVEGLCEYLWPSRKAVMGFISRGFQPPEKWQGHLKQVWLSHIFDPLPEWCEQVLGLGQQ